jgi:ATP-dependent Lhr-like helicase
MSAAAQLSVDELVDDELARIARFAVTNSEVGDAIAAVRRAVDHHARTAEFEALLEVLRDAGVFVCHPVVSAISVRALRPGSDERIDRTIVRLIDDWDDLEARFGIDLDLRTYATLRASDVEFDRGSGLSAPPEDARAWRAGQITGLLWQRGAALRTQTLRAPNPFVSLPSPDPTLLRMYLRSGHKAFDVGDASLALAPDGPLARTGEVDLHATSQDARLLREALLTAACTAIEAGPLLHYPRAAGVQRDVDGLRVRLVLDLVGE